VLPSPGLASAITSSLSLPGTLPTNSAGSSATINLAAPDKPGDCDGSGKVTIDEVQSAINMYLGLKTVSACVDTNGDGFGYEET
jgi:hypothetical protein